MGLANLLFEYDLLGVYHPVFRPEDDEEYDDLVGTLREGLEAGQSPGDLSEVFAEVLRDQYGLGAATSEAELPFIEKVHAWWQDQPS